MLRLPYIAHSSRLLSIFSITFCLLFSIAQAKNPASDSTKNSSSSSSNNAYTNRELPDPLPLKTAISFANKHPRLALTADKQLKYKHQQPLYLNCHNLAYNNLSSLDTYRTDNINHLVSPEQLQQLYILKSYLDVSLSDLVFMADNEIMSSAFIQFDRAKTRMELKQYSELFVAEKEANYYEQLQRYQSSGATQRITRAVLAQEINSTGRLPRDVIPMPKWDLPKELPEFNGLLNNIEKNNLWLTKHKGNLNPDEQALLILQLRQVVTELLLQLETLNNAYERFEKAANFQDLRLEQSRTLYEQEVKSDLGDSMAKQTRVQFKQQQVSYCLNTAWAQLNILQGKPILETPVLPSLSKESTTIPTE